MILKNNKELLKILLKEDTFSKLSEKISSFLKGFAKEVEISPLDLINLTTTLAIIK